MIELKSLLRKIIGWWRLAAFGVLLLSLLSTQAGLGQASDAASPQNLNQEQNQNQNQEQNQEQNQKQEHAGEGARATPDSATQTSPTQTSPTQTSPTQTSPTQANPEKTAPEQEHKISPKEAEELFREVDTILKFASKDTDLPIKQKVKRRLASRDEVVKYLEKTMAEDKDAQRMRRSELVLKKFGLLPRDFDLQTFLVALLREQVAGYYDPKTETVNLLDWIDSEQQRPVLAHELTHALQDQSLGLEKWMKAGDADLNDIAQPTSADIEADEISDAREAVVEGQAMVTLLDYTLAPMGQSLLTSPQIAEALKQGMAVGSDDTPLFQRAPVFLKESLTFPYRWGLDFETAVLKSGGKKEAFAGTLAHPPTSTRQIMEPKTYLSAEELPPLPVPDFKQDFKNYERFDMGEIGEFDVSVLIDQYAGPNAPLDLYTHWRGGYYYATHPKGDAAAPLALMYFSRWSNAEKASQFAEIYGRELPKRYKQVHEAAGEAAFDDKAESLTGTHTWMTEEGTVVMDVNGDSVLITENYDASTTERLEKELLGTGK